MPVTTHRRFLATIAAAAACLGIAAAPASAVTSREPVQYGMAGAVDGARHALDDAPPPGANNWSCRPASAHPDPVVLVPGAGTQAAVEWRSFAPLLTRNGYCVYTLDYGRNPRLSPPLADRLDGLRSLQDSATTELAPLVDRVLATTGAHRVDLVGHSEGTAMPRYYLTRLGGAAKVHRSVDIAPLWRGTRTSAAASVAPTAAALGVNVTALGGIAHLAPGLLQLQTGSRYLVDLNADRPFPQPVQFTSIVTRTDKTVVPYTSGLAPARPNTTNVVLQAQCPSDTSDHLLVTYDPVVAQHVLRALDPTHPQPLRCAGLPPGSH